MKKLLVIIFFMTVLFGCQTEQDSRRDNEESSVNQMVLTDRMLLENIQISESVDIEAVTNPLAWYEIHSNVTLAEEQERYNFLFQDESKIKVELSEESLYLSDDKTSLIILENALINSRLIDYYTSDNLLGIGMDIQIIASEGGLELTSTNNLEQKEMDGLAEVVTDFLKEHFLIEQAEMEVIKISELELQEYGKFVEESNAKEEKVDFSKIPDFYLVLVQPLIMGYPVLSEDIITDEEAPEKWLLGTKVNVVVSEDKVKEFRVDSWSAPEGKVGEAKVYAVKDVLNWIKAIFENQIIPEPLMIEQIDLVYALYFDASEEKQVYKPIWRVVFDNYPNMYIDPMTGKEVGM